MPESDGVGGIATVKRRVAGAADRQLRLLGLLACPYCVGRLSFDVTAERFGAVVDAELGCAECGPVGVIRSYRPSFHAADLGDGWAPAGLAESTIDLRAVETIGDWTDLPSALLATSVGSCVTGTTTSAGIVVELATHDWAGAALVSFGEAEERVELYSDDGSTTRRLVLADPEGAGPSRRWSIVVAPGAEHRPERTQAIVQSVAELVPAVDAAPLEHVPANLGNPYPPRFAELLADLDPAAIVVDIGGGDRRHPDPRVLNFEYLKFRHADFFGDGLHLPLASNSVDLIMSQAVLEHVPDPMRAVEELRRVLRPGGRIYAEFAFMQPLHAVPFHFFNITPHGADLLFADWDVQASGVFGGLSSTMEWFFRLLGAGQKIGQDRTEAVLRSLGDLDAQLTERELAHVASAVFVEAVKPE